MTRGQDDNSTAGRASRLRDARAVREVVPAVPGLSFRTHVHGYPDPMAGWHYHPEIEIHLVTAGTGTVVVG